MSNYIIYSTKEDYYRVIYRDVINWENVEFIVSPVAERSFLLRLLYKVIMSPKLAFVFKRFRNCLNPLYDRVFNNTDRTIYLFFYGRLEWVEYGLLDYLKRKHPDCLTVCYFQDLIAKKKVDIKKVKTQFDLVLNYDEEEAEKYSLIYAPTPFSYVKQKNMQKIETDVYFVGQAKERLNEIYEMFNLLSSNGFKCDFYIVGVSEDKQIKKNGLHFINKKISYLENLEKISHCKIALELMQSGAVGYTLRTWEAIAYNKLLWTNNTSLKHSKLAEKYNILTFEKIDDEVVNQLKTFRNKEYTYKNEFSPINLLKRIDEYGK